VEDETPLSEGSSGPYGTWLAGEGTRMEILSVIAWNGGVVVTYKDPRDPLQRKRRRHFDGASPPSGPGPTVPEGPPASAKA